MRHVFALITQTSLVSVADLYRLIAPLEVNALDCATAWGLEAPDIVVIDDYERIDAAFARHIHPVVFVDSNDLKGIPEGLLAEHWWDPMNRGPAARVFVDRSSGLLSGPNSALENAGHEIGEGLVDPEVVLFRDHPTKPGVQLALETFDMTQDTYPVHVGRDVYQVANFVTTHYFSRKLASDAEALKAFFRAGGKLDFAARLKHPGEIGPEGYAIERRTDASGDTHVYPVYPSAGARELKPGKLHPWARSVRRGAFKASS